MSIFIHINMAAMKKQMESNIEQSNFYKNVDAVFPTVVRTFIKCGGDVNAGTFERLPYLHYAIRKADVQTVRLLLEAGADPNKTSGGGCTPLDFTVLPKSKFNIKIIKLLLAYGADQLIKDTEGRTPLHQAFFERRSSVVELLLTRLPKGANPTDETNLSAFHIACAHGVDDVVRDFLEYGVQINHYAEFKQIPVRLNGLHFAILDNRKSTVELLLQRGADVNDLITSGEMLLHLACQCNLEKFLMTYDGQTIEELKDVELSARNQLDIINLLLDRGVDINATNKDCLTPLLYMSCGYNCTNISGWRRDLYYPSTDKYLFSNEDLDRQLKLRRRLIAQNLLDRGAATDTRTLDSDKNFLHLVFQSQIHPAPEIDAEIVKLAIKHGADVNALDEHRLTPLHTIIDQSHFYDIVFDSPAISANIELLLNQGADMNARNVNGRTPVSLLIQKYTDSLLLCGVPNELRNLSSLKVLLVHAQRLLTLGLPVHPEIRDCLEEKVNLSDFDSVKKECSDELERMKQVQVDADTSLYQLLRTGLDGTGQSLTETKLQAILKNFKMTEEYSHYAELFEQRIRRKELLQRAESVVKQIASCELPLLCTEIIFKYLTNFDLRNLAEVRNSERKAKLSSAGRGH